MKPMVSGRVDIAVFAGHVVLVGVVDSRANRDGRAPKGLGRRHLR
jgi:osmotically-inducible protein OsmY